MPHMIRRFVLHVGIALGLVWLIELVFATVATTISRHLERWSVTAAAHPWVTVSVTALVATVIQGIAVAGHGTSWDVRFAAHLFIWSWGLGVAALMTVGTTAPASIAAASSAFLGHSILRFSDPATLALPYAPWVLAAWLLLAKASDARACAHAALLLVIASALVLFASPPKDALTILLVLWSIGLLAIVFGDGSRAVKGYRLAAAIVAVLAIIGLTAARGWLSLNAFEASVTLRDEPSVQFAGRAQMLSMILGPLAPVPLSPGLQTLTSAFVVAALLSPTRLVAHRSNVACVLGGAMAIAAAFGVLTPEPIAGAPVPILQTVSLSLLIASIVLGIVVSAVGIRAVLEARRAALVVMTVGIAVGAAWVFSEVAGGSDTIRANGWLTLFALSGAVALPASLRAAARSFPRVLPMASAAALAGFLLVLGLLV